MRGNDVYEPVAHFQPEIRGVTFLGLEVAEDFVDQVHAALGMAMLHPPADHGSRPHEDAFFALAEVLGPTKVSFTGGQLSIANSSSGFREPEGKTISPCPTKTCSSTPPCNSRQFSHFLGRIDKRVTDFFASARDVGPVRIGEFLRGRGEEYALFLLHHSLGLIQQGHELLLDVFGQFRVVFDLIEAKTGRFEEVTNLVIVSPHDHGGPGQTLLSHIGEQHLFLAAIMYFYLGEILQGVGDAPPGLIGTELPASSRKAEVTFSISRFSIRNTLMGWAGLSSLSLSSVR